MSYGQWYITNGISMRSRHPLALIGLILGGTIVLGGAPWPAVAKAPGFTPFVAQALPQGAPGDFDGDGRPDQALIQDGVGGFQVSVRLSGSSGAVLLDGKVVGVIAADIDHDGYIDLVTAAPSGQVVNWLNDGRGGFTRQEALPSDSLSSVAIVDESLQDTSAALGSASPLGDLGVRSETLVLATGIRSLTDPPAIDLTFLSLESLRAPPLLISLD
jgi:hypothetical protein